MKGFESNFGKKKPNFAIEEEGNQRALEAEYLSDLEKHSEISPENQLNILEKIKRFKELSEGTAIPQVENEINILRAGVQNIATREILTQEDGPTSICRQDFVKMVASIYPDQVEAFFSKEIWERGIQTTARSIERELRKNDELLNKEVIFIDEIDASNATDYVLTGRLPAKDGGDSIHIAKLVQVGNSLNYKTPEDIREQHIELAERLRNRASYPHTFMEVQPEAEQIIADIIMSLDQSSPNKEDREDLAQLGLISIAKSSFYPRTIEKIRGLTSLQDMKDDLSTREYEVFKNQVYVFALLAEDSVATNKKIDELMSVVIESRAEYGIDWIDTEDPAYVKDLVDCTKDIALELTSVIKNSGLKKEIPYKIISKIIVRHDTYKELPADQRELEIEIDNNITAMYDIDQNALLEIVGEVINRSL
ncbi:MAG: hypothetical protein WD552_00660 [Candidatus Paceibacterota bacterium]